MKDRLKFANSHDLQFAKREVFDLVRSEKFWIGFAAVMAVLTVSAPFDSGEEFSMAGRALYWTAVSLLTFFPAVVVVSLVQLHLNRAGKSPWVSSFLGGLVAGIPVGLIVFAINSYVAGNDDGELKDIPRLIAMCTPITIAVSLLIQLVSDIADAPGARPVVVPEAGSPKLLQRVKHSIRGELLSLQAQDHYVEVTTTRGQELVLIRLADAIDELGGLDGMQVHRSWWVNKSAIDEVIRNGHKMDLRLRDARIVPVGRSRQKDVMAWYRPKHVP